MNQHWRLNAITPPPNWANGGPRKEIPMADALSHLIEACRAIEFVAASADVAMPTIHLASYSDGIKLFAHLKNSETGRYMNPNGFGSRPAFDPGTEMTISGIKIVWPGPDMG